MHRYNKIIRLFYVLPFILVVCLMGCRHVSVPQVFQEVKQLPRIEPDYSDIVIPPNIAPLNFIIHEPGLKHIVKIHSTNGEPITIVANDAKVIIPIRYWKKLLNENLGQKVIFDIYIQKEKNQWDRFNSLFVEVAHETIDSFLAYRMFEPQYEYYHEMGLYQRNLENYW